MSHKSSLLMKVMLVGALLAAPAMAASIGFSTGGGSDSWTLTRTGSDIILSFDNLEIDNCDSVGDAVLGDSVELPSMALINWQIDQLTVNGFTIDVITAILEPVQNSQLVITSNAPSQQGPQGISVFSASIENNAILTVGSSFMGYSNPQDDLNNVAHTPGYSDILDTFYLANNNGFDVDLSFGGDASSSIVSFLQGSGDGSISGVMSGQIVAVPEPTTIALLAIGGIAFLRKRKA